MVKRGPHLRPQAGEAQHGPFCWTGRFGQGDQRLHCGSHGQDRSVSEGCEQTRCAVDGSEETLPTTSSRATVAMAVRRSQLPVVCVETRHMQAVLKAQIDKTDRNDARGITGGQALSDHPRRD